jgi:hypothetical protein
MPKEMRRINKKAKKEVEPPKQLGGPNWLFIYSPK